jgi:Zn-dependent M28 family amino/carboxypeptidase
MRLFGAAGLDLATLQAAAAQRGFKAVPMPLKARGHVRNIIRRSKSNNIVGLLPGSERPDEFVIYMAHWDHLGRSLSLAGGDSIFNGAVDNATGVAGLLTLARAYRAMLPRPKRSVLFLAVTAEESGLLGSKYYADHPLAPLERTAAAINLDGMAPLGRARDIVVIGRGASELEDYLAEEARRQDRVLKPDPMPENGAFYRSDHFNLAKKGVPSLYVDSGTDIRGRPAGWALAQYGDYVARRYHQVGDNYDPAWDVSGILEDLVLVFNVGARVANDSGWPNWYAGNEFRATRDRSAAARAAGRQP